MVIRDSVTKKFDNDLQTTGSNSSIAPVTPQTLKSNERFGKTRSFWEPGFTRNYNDIYPRDSYVNLQNESRLTVYDPYDYSNPSQELYDMEIGADTEYKSGFEHETNKDNISIQLGVIGHKDPQFREITKNTGYFFINDTDKMQYIRNNMVMENAKFVQQYWNRNLNKYDGSTIITTYNNSDIGCETPLARVIKDQLGVDIYNDRQARGGNPKKFKILITGFFLTVDLQAVIAGTGVENVEKLVKSGRRLTVESSKKTKGANTRDLIETKLFFTRDRTEYQVFIDLRDASGVATSAKELLKQTNISTDTKTSLDDYKSKMDEGFAKFPHDFVKYGMGDVFDVHKGLITHKENSIRQFVCDPDGSIKKPYLLVKKKIVDLTGDNGSPDDVIKQLASDFGVFPETGGAIDNVLFDNAVLNHINEIFNTKIDSIYDSLSWFKYVATVVRRSLAFNQNKQTIYKEVWDEKEQKYVFKDVDITNMPDVYLNITQGGRFVNMAPTTNDLTEMIRKMLNVDAIDTHKLAGILMDQDLSSCYGKGMRTTNVYFGDARIKYSVHSPEHQNEVVFKKLLRKSDFNKFIVEYQENEGITLEMFYKYFYKKGVLPTEGWLCVISTKEMLEYSQLFFVSKPKSKENDHLSFKTIDDNLINVGDTIKAISNDKTSIFTHEIINSVFNEGCAELVDSMKGERHKDFFKKVRVTAFESYLKTNEKLFLKELLGSIIHRCEFNIKHEENKSESKIDYEIVDEARTIHEKAKGLLINQFDDKKRGIKEYTYHVSPNINATISTTLGELAVNDLVARRKKYKSLGKAHEDYYIQGILKLFINTFYGIQASVYFTASNAIVGNNITMKPRVMTFLMERSTFSGSTITDGAMYRVDIFPDLEKIRSLMDSNFNPWDIVRDTGLDDKGQACYKMPEILEYRDKNGNYKKHKFPTTNQIMGYTIKELIDHGEVSGVLYQSLLVEEPDGKEVIYSDLTYADKMFKDEPKELVKLKDHIDSKYHNWIGAKNHKAVTDLDTVMLEYFNEYWGHLMDCRIFQYDLERKMYFNAGDELTQGGGDYKIRELIRKRGAESKKNFMDENGNDYETTPSKELFKSMRDHDGGLSTLIPLPKYMIKNGIGKSGYLNAKKGKHNTHLELGDGIAVIEAAHMAPAAVKFKNAEIDKAVMSKLDKIHDDYGIGRAGIALVLKNGELFIDRIKMNNLMSKLSICDSVEEVGKIFNNIRRSISRALDSQAYADYLTDIIEKDKAVCSYNGFSINIKKWNKGRVIRNKYLDY